MSFTKSIAIFAIACYFESNGMLVHNAAVQKHLAGALCSVGARSMRMFVNQNEHNNLLASGYSRSFFKKKSDTFSKIHTYLNNSNIKDLAKDCAMFTCAFACTVALGSPLLILSPGLTMEKQPRRERENTAKDEEAL